MRVGAARHSAQLRTETLRNIGQSLWLDNITRDLLNSGTLQRHFDELPVTRLTSNPTIFDHAIRSSADYDSDISQVVSRAKSRWDLFFDLALADFGLGSGSTAAFAIDALARRHREGLRFVGIPTSQRTAERAVAVGIPLTSFAEQRWIDLAIEGADEVERGTLNLIKGRGGALLHEKTVAVAARRLAIVVDSRKLVDKLGTRARLPVEVVSFGMEATQATLQAIGASVKVRLASRGQPFVTESGNRILDRKFDSIADPARLEERIRTIVGVVESGLFISRADPVFVADACGVHRLDSARSHRGTPPIIDAQHGRKQPGIVTCSALKRSYRQIVIGDRPEARLVYLRGGKDLFAERLAGRHDHFMPASLLSSQIDTLEEPDPGENPHVIDEGAPSARTPEQIVDEIIRWLGTCAIVTSSVAAHAH